MTTYESSDSTAAQSLPPAPDREPQLVDRSRKTKVKALLANAGGANVARVILGAVIALLLVVTWFGSNPSLNDAGNPSEWKSQLSQAAIKNGLNNGDTKGAPQQSVVNGWYANDIAIVQASQNSYIAASTTRNGSLLALVGLGFAGELIIRGVERSRRKR
ncbi:hypothetical protein [Arthrobacter cavernae]|uniref:Uncharacterized protein n=1 Tax=Arthrobacter cavernae TaxID=2817681 RepID=A0A939HD71_9MICC|nr:hypothetical protein [Arthrobacter cavernae]MBO1268704.1 hypothetical protein [Arthrobacter cavernae]